MVTVTGVDNRGSSDSTSPMAMITHSINSTVPANSNYATLSGLTSVTFTAIDNETTPGRGLLINSTAINADENGGTASYTVSLATQPTGNVVITVASGDANVAGVNPASLTFSNSNWNTAQTVTVTGVNNRGISDSTSPMAMITHTINSGMTADTDYATLSGLTSVTFTARNTYLGTPPIGVSADGLTASQHWLD